MPVLLGPGEMVGPAKLGFQLCRWRPPFGEQIGVRPVVEELGRAEMRKVYCDRDSVSGCFYQFQVRSASCHAANSLETQTLFGSRRIRLLFNRVLRIWPRPWQQEEDWVSHYHS